jgi:hypothetical protein
MSSFFRFWYDSGMRRKGFSYIKVIGVMTAIVALLLFFMLAVYRSHINAANGNRVPDVAGKSPFNGSRAYETLQRVLAFGPRPSGSPALGQVREMITGELEKAGLTVEEHPFTAATPIGAVPMVNIVGIVRGDKPGVIALSNHYESKLFKDFQFVGANDGGSTTAWMLEMARTLGPTRSGRTIWLIFFDGEEAFVNWTAEDSLYGSRAFVAELQAQNRLRELRALINVDMIGDCYLAIRQEIGAPKWLKSTIWDTAAELQYQARFVPFVHSVMDDHIPFRQAGVDAINIIDFTYGPTDADHAQTWHTERDTIDKVCAESLQIVGDVIYHALPKIEGQLDRQKG